MPRSRSLKILGAHVRELRTARGMTQAALAEKADVATETISRIEGAKVNLTVEAVEQLAHALGVKVAALFDDPGARTARPKVRPALAKIVSLIDRLPDGDLADVLVGLRALLRVRGRGRARRR